MNKSLLDTDIFSDITKGVNPTVASHATAYSKAFPSARQLVRQDGGVTAPRAGRGRPGWPMAAHQLASAYKNFSEMCGKGGYTSADTEGSAISFPW